MRKKIINILILNCITFISLFLIYQLWNKDFSIPFFFDQDGVGALLTIKNMADGESVWHLGNMNAPHFQSSYLVDFILQGVIIRILTFFTKNVGIIANVYWVLTYILTSITTYMLLSKCKCNVAISMVGAIAYSFLPYHYYRTGHFWLMGCYMIPIGTMLVIELINIKKEELSWKKIVKYTAVGLLFGASGLYYSLFLVIFLLYSIITNFLLTKNKSIFLVGILIMMCLLLPVFVFMGIPAIFHFTTEARDLNEARGLYQMVYFALFPIIMLLPIPEHRIDAISKLTENMYNELGISGENFTAHLGVFMAIGFILSIVWVLFYQKNKKKKYDDIILTMGKFNIMALVISTVGGFCLLIGIFLTSSVRCFNRISIFIALFSDVVVCLLLQYLYERIKIRLKYKKIILIVGSVFLIIFCLLDQTTSAFARFSAYDISTRQYVRSYETNEKEYSELQTYISKIEQNISDDTMVLQLPLVSSSSQFYQARLAVFSQKIQWSSSVTNNSNQVWLSGLSNSDIYRILDIAVLYGFKGILVDKKCYENEELFFKEKDELTDVLDIEPIVNVTGDLYYFSLDNFYNSFVKKYDDIDVEKLTSLIDNTLLDDQWINFTNQVYMKNGEDDYQVKNTIQYGPYVTLDEGDYNIQIIGTNLNDTKISCTCQKGKKSLEIANLNISENCITYTIHISKKIEDVEFLAINEDHDMNTFLYSYKKKAEE